MPLGTLQRIEEARGRAATVSGIRQEAAAQRQGFVSGIPIGGATETMQGSAGSVGNLDRRSFMQQLLQSYLACPWASACIDVTARTVTAGGVDCVPNKWSGDMLNIPNPPPVVQEVDALLSYINPYDDARQFFRTVITDLLIFGDSFTEIVYFMGKPIALYALDPATMLITSDGHGNVTGYHQTTDNGDDVKFEVWEVIHVKLDAPDAGLYGVSPTQKAVMPITVWLFTAALIKETMKRGDPPRLHVDWPMALSGAEMQRFQQQYQIRNLGPKNIGNPFETKANTVVQELSPNKLTEWMNMKEQVQREIRSTYGVPATILGLSDGSVSGASTLSTEQRVFQINTCGPIAEAVLEKFTFRLLTQCYGINDWHLRFGDVDWRDDLTIEQIADMRIKNGRWTVNRSRAVVGEPPVPGGDTAVLVDRTAILPWSDLQKLSDANIAVLKAKASSGTPGQGTPGPRMTSTQKLVTGSRSRVGAGKPTPKVASKSGGGQNPNAESVREQYARYAARKEALLQEVDEPNE